MNINNATAIAQLGTLPQSQLVERNPEPQTQPGQDSTIVQLSPRAVQLSLGVSPDSERRESAAGETAEPASTQRSEGESAGRSIDVYA